MVPIGEGNQIEVQLSSHQRVHSIRILPEYHQEWGDERFSIDLNLPLSGKNADEVKTNQLWNPLLSWVEEFGIEGENQEYSESYDYPKNERNNTITVDSLNPFVIFVDKQKYLNLTVLAQLGTGYAKLDHTFFEQSEITQISSKTSDQWEYSNFYYEKPFTPSRLKQGELQPLNPTIDEACTTQASGDVLIISKACFESKDDFKHVIRDLWWNDIGLQYHFEEISYEIYWKDDINKLFCIKHDFHDTKEAIWLQECSTTQKYWYSTVGSESKQHSNIKPNYCRFFTRKWKRRLSLGLKFGEKTVRNKISSSKQMGYYWVKWPFLWRNAIFMVALNHRRNKNW